MHGTTTRHDNRTQQSLARLEALAKLMDGAFVIPGTTIRFGLDGIVGLIPVAGDMLAGLVSTYLIWEARQLGAPGWLIGRMLANAFLDTAIGAVPVVGDAFDVRIVVVDQLPGGVVARVSAGARERLGVGEIGVAMVNP